jgi:4-aminobutyrate aminotransferase-like enzyme
MGQRLMDRLREIDHRGIIGEIRGRGLLIGVEFVSNRTSRTCFSPEHEVTRQVYEACLEEGLIVYPCSGTVDGKQGDQIMLAPPFIISSVEVDDLADRLDRAIGTVANRLELMVKVPLGPGDPRE